MPGRVFKNGLGKLVIWTNNSVIFRLKLLTCSERNNNMAGRRTMFYTAEEVARSVMDISDDGDVSDFEGGSNNSARDIEH